jgi:periplasmic copper chaperone A
VPNRSFATRRVAVICSTVLLAAGLAACGSDSPTTAGATPSASASAVSGGLTLEDGWVKAVDASMAGGDTSATPSPSTTASSGMDDMADMGAMSAMFGTLRNTSSTDITITGGSSPVAGVVELHETVKNDSGQMQMQPRQGGFVIPAGGTFVLQPGGNHVMLMALNGALDNGTSTTVTLTTSGGEVTLTVPVRAFSGAQESYVPTPSGS